MFVARRKIYSIFFTSENGQHFQNLTKIQLPNNLQRSPDQKMTRNDKKAVCGECKRARINPHMAQSALP